MAEPRRDIATLKSKIMRLEGALKKIKKERHAPDWDDHVNTPGDMFKDLKEKVKKDPSLAFYNGYEIARLDDSEIAAEALNEGEKLPPGDYTKTDDGLIPTGE